MNKDEAKNQAWLAYRRDKYPNEHNTEPHRNFDSGYEAGQRAERERIADEIADIVVKALAGAQRILEGK